MKKRLAIVAVALFCLCILLISSTSFAAEIGAKLGYSNPMGDIGDVFDGAITIGAYGEQEVIPDLAIEATLLHHKHDGPSLFIVTTDLTINELTLNAKYYFPIDRFKPYVTGGLGLYLWEASAGAGGFTLGGDDGTDLGINFGGGVSFDMTSHVALNADIRYHKVMGVFDGDYLNIIFGAAYKFTWAD